MRFILLKDPTERPSSALFAGVRICDVFLFFLGKGFFFLFFFKWDSEKLHGGRAVWVSCDDGCLGLLWLPLSPSLWDDQTPQEAEWIGFYGWGSVGCKDVNIKIKERFSCPIR